MSPAPTITAPVAPATGAPRLLGEIVGADLTRHLATFGKTHKQKVGLRGTSHLDASDAKKIKECFPYGR